MFIILLPGSIIKFGLYSLKDMVPPSEVGICGHINWSLAQALQQFSLGLSQSFPAEGGGKVIPKSGFHFKMQKRPVLELSGTSLAKRPHMESRTVACQGGRMSTGGSVCASSIDSIEKGSHGGWHS